MNLNPTQTRNVGKYIRSCEIDRLQLEHYEMALHDCNRELYQKPGKLEFVATFVLGALIGVYAAKGSL